MSRIENKFIDTLSFKGDGTTEAYLIVISLNGFFFLFIDFLVYQFTKKSFLNIGEWYSYPKIIAFLTIVFLYLFSILFMIIIEMRRQARYHYIKLDLSILLKETANSLRTIPNELLKKCLKWTTTNYITIIFAIAVVFVFLYYEKELVEAFFPFINKITESNFGIYLLKGFYFFLFITLFCFATKTAINKTLSDGRTVFLSILACTLFVYCATK